MPRNGNGVFVRENSRTNGERVWQNDLEADVRIRADLHDAHDQDLANGITQSLSRDGQTQPTAHLPMNNKRHTNVANAQLRNQYATAGQVQDGVLWHGVDNGSANNYNVSLSPSLIDYKDGLLVSFRAKNTNGSGGCTLKINGRPVKPLVRTDGSALSQAQIQSNRLVVAAYNAAADRFECLNVNRPLGIEEGHVPRASDAMLRLTNLNEQRHATRTRYRHVVTGANDDTGIYEWQADDDGHFALRALDDDGELQATLLEVVRDAAGVLAYIKALPDMRVRGDEAKHTVLNRDSIRVYESSEPSTLADLINDETIEEEHGLGGTPTMFEAFAVCTTADAGYAVGDEVRLSLYADTFANSTQVGIAIQGSTTGFGFTNPTTNGLTNITESRWNLVFRAERVVYA